LLDGPGPSGEARGVAVGLPLLRGKQRMTAHALLSATWHELVQRRGSSGPQAQLVLDELVAAYLEPARQYHTLEHIAQLLRHLEEHGHGVIDRDAVVLAIIFHDAVYDPRRHDNEQESAALARARLTSLAFANPLIGKVARHIEATQHAPALVVADPDLALLLDLDLATLAAAPKEYGDYAKAIRREYAHLPDSIYQHGRRQVLASFLAQARIYRTEALHALWEERARANIMGEIAGLT
jgi:predicted metal-dependent HD superfamily phosphohydrolase